MASQTVRLGTGAGFSSDRLDPALDLARHGALDWLVFETIGERTLAFGHRDRRLDPTKGYNSLLERRMRAVLPLISGTSCRIMTNMGVAHPQAAAELTARIAREAGLTGLCIAWVGGDDVTDLLTPETELWQGGCLADAGLELVGANAYLGSDAILPAIETGAEIIITGRVADPSLFLAPLMHRFGWAVDDWPMLGAGTLAGHLMECGMQVTGGYFADPGFKAVPDLAQCGYPIAEVAADGGVVITKLADAGGCVTAATVKEQLLYEVHDPSAYLTPDVTADFSAVMIEEQTTNRVFVSGANGRSRPEKLKVTVGFDGGFLGEAGVSYAGPGALQRAELARSILQERLLPSDDPIRLDIIGLDSLHGTATVRTAETSDVRLRAAIRSTDRERVEWVVWEVEALLCCGPAGGGGYRGSITPSVVTRSASIERAAVQPTVSVIEA